MNTSTSQHCLICQKKTYMPYVVPLEKLVHKINENEILDLYVHCYSCTILYISLTMNIME